ncbi:MAG: hypothetical protein Q8K60_00045 [Parachlamydiaceae bacterium]|nr:hypothetical protein [Parachlamydiaceae bacterium]
MVDPISGARPNQVNPNISAPQNPKKFKEAQSAVPVDPVEAEAGAEAGIEKQIEMSIIKMAAEEMKKDREKAKEKGDERRKQAAE